MTRSRVRAGIVGLAVVVSTLTAAGPAVADDGSDVMTPGQAILIFGGIPLTVVALVYLLVSAPGWTRSGRSNSAEAWTGDPVSLGGGPAATTAALEAKAGEPEAEQTGGTSAEW